MNRIAILICVLVLAYPAACLSRAVYINQAEFRPQVAHWNRLHEYAVQHPESTREMLQLELRVFQNEVVANCRTMLWPLTEPDGFCGSYDVVPEPPKEARNQ